MTNAELLDLMLLRLGANRNPNVRKSCLNELNAVLKQLEAESFQPWFLEHTFNSMLLVGADQVELPNDFIIEWEEGQLTLTDVDLVIYPEKRVKEQLPRYEWRNRPVAYALFGNRLVFPGPSDRNYSLSLPYLRKAGAPIADNNQPVSHLWLVNAPDYPIYRALFAVASFHTREQGQPPNFDGLAARARTELFKLHEARQHTNARYQLEP